VTTPGYAERDQARWVPEPPKVTPAVDRSPFERDRARVLHSSALRRLAAKTQVHGVGEDDFPRTRLTHSLECAQIGRELAATFGADPDLVDGACLAHDLGHPPFGHNGEAALNDAAAACGGFEGNAQSLRLLTRLEPKVPGAGLNLTRATLDATCKYPWSNAEGHAKFGVYDDDLAVFGWIREDAPGHRRCFEAEVMDWADDVAYSVHDLEDAVHGGLVELATLDRDKICEVTASTYSSLPQAELQVLLDELLDLPFLVATTTPVGLKRATSELIARFTSAAVAATRAAYGAGPFVRYTAEVVVPPRTAGECALLKGVTAATVMRRRRVLADQARQRELVEELVALVAAGGPDTLDAAGARAWEEAKDDAARLRLAIDRVAGLTDRSAVVLHRRLRRARRS
jgi:dGTPase